MTDPRPRTLLAAAALAATLLAVPAAAHARRVGGKNFGIGLILGTPTGFTAEARFGGVGLGTALDFALGLVYLHADYLVFLVDLNRGGTLSVPLYIGFGGFLADHDRGKDIDDDLRLGLRVPFGISLDFRTAPFQIFAELAVRVVLVSELDDEGDADLTGALGFRFFF